MDVYANSRSLLICKKEYMTLYTQAEVDVYANSLLISNLARNSRAERYPLEENDREFELIMAGTWQA